MAWRDFLSHERARLFVGRERELASIETFLAGANRLLYISGPAGVGKTALLHELERIAHVQDLRVSRLDAGLLSATPAAIAAAITADAHVLAIDEFDAIAPLHGWIRDAIFPELPSGTRVVVAGRAPPDERWIADSGWRGLMQWIPLRNLRRSAAVEYLQRRGAGRLDAESLARMAHGHPLCLSVIGDLVGSSQALPSAATAATIEAKIRRALVDGTPPDRLRILEAAALATVVDEPLLGAMIGEDAREAVRWLASRPFVETTDRGLVLHDVAAEAIVAELRWRDPARVRALRHAALRHCGERLRRDHVSTVEAEETLRRVLRLLAHEPAAQSLALLPGTSQLYADTVRDADRRRFVEAVERFEGPDASRIARAWLESAAATLHALRDATGTAVGFALYIDLPTQVAAAIGDPIVDAFVATLTASHPIREHERATLARWFLSVDGYQAPDPVQPQLFVHMSGRLAFTPGVVVGASVHRDPEAWLQRPDRTHGLFTRIDALGGQYGIFGTDWRREPAWAWFERVVETLSGIAVGPPPPEVVLLERQGFAREVKRVLRYLHEPEQLQRSPLLWAPLVRRRHRLGSTAELTAWLRDVVMEACDRVAPESATLLRVAFIEQPRRKQLAVASDLGLGFSTYRRHLADAIAQLVEALWAMELASG
jgi:hypothetical protein